MTVVAELGLTGGGGERADLRRTFGSHGVATLAPNHVDEQRWTLQTVLDVAGMAHRVSVAPASDNPSPAVAVDVTGRIDRRTRDAVAASIRRMLSLDEDLSPFYERAARDPKLEWVCNGAGRMLRSPTVFEDVVKTICTTNCTWSATIRMTNALVSELGAAARDGSRAFPSPTAMAQAPAQFYEGVARTGYRGAYLRTLATEVAEGRLDLEEFTDRELPDAEVERRLLALPGVGPYAAAHIMLTSLCRYRRLVFDSWTRPAYAKIAGKPLDDAAIERRFRRYGPYAGLAFWLTLTRHWVDEATDAGNDLEVPPQTPPT